jgi:hypothetical protein
MKILNKIKNIIMPPKKKTGSIIIHLINRENAEVHTQEIYGITIFRDKEEMRKYLHATVMTTVPSNILLLSYNEIK